MSTRQGCSARLAVDARFGGAGGAQVSIAEAMVKELKVGVFPGREVRYVRVGADGKRVEVV